MNAKKTFTEFNKYFYAKVKSLDLFTCQDINLFKVVLDGLRVDYSGKGKFKTYLFYPYWLYSIILYFKRLREVFSKSDYSLEESLSNYQNIQNLILDEARYITKPSGKLSSLYFENISNSMNKENFITIAKKNIQNFPCHFFYSDFRILYQNQSLNQEQKKLRKSLIITFKRIKKSRIFNKVELLNIKYAFDLFFLDYKILSIILGLLPKIEKAYFICHYHKEGQIYALKKKKIKTIELQHGLIAEQDVFYVLPEIIKPYKNKTLFADKILVYGKYWKDTLLKGFEYSEKQIEIIGYYLYNNVEGYENERKIIVDLIDTKKNVIFVTTQTFLHKHFINYIKWLENDIIKNRDNSTIILLKPHPAEKVEIYNSAFESSNLVKVVTFPLDLLFEYATIHISIYSTTLYDALRYNLNNYSLYIEECKDYIQTIIDSNIAKKISISETPLMLSNNTNQIVEPIETYFAKFDSNKLY